MATASEVKAGLDDIATKIRNVRQKAAQAKAAITAGDAELADIPTTFADLIATIDAYGTSDTFEALSKAEKAKLQSEFSALRSKTASAKAAIAAIDFAT